MARFLDRATDALNNALDYRGWVPPTLPERAIKAVTAVRVTLDRYHIRAFKVGGLRFVQIRRLSMSFCVKRRLDKVARARAAITEALDLAR